MAVALKFFDDKAFMEELARREPVPVWDQAAYEWAQRERVRLERLATEALTDGFGCGDDALYYGLKVQLRTEDEGDVTAWFKEDEGKLAIRAFRDLFDTDIEVRGMEAFLDWMAEVLAEQVLRCAERRQQLINIGERFDAYDAQVSAWLHEAPKRSE